MMVAHAAGHRWEGELVPPVTGDYQFKTYSNGRIKMWLDGKVVIDHWRQGWLTDEDQIKVRLEAGHHYRHQNRVTAATSDHDAVDLENPRPGRKHVLVVRGRRRRGLLLHLRSGARPGHCRFPPVSPGQASMMPEWAFGLWQSRQRYETAQAKPRRGEGISPPRPFPSTTSCRTGNTGRPTPGVRTSSIPRAFPRSGWLDQEPCTRSTRTS